MSVRAKFVCTNVQNNPQTQSKSVALSPVIDGSDENKSFAKYTPSGQVNLEISDETAASEFLVPLKSYYLDFTEAES